MLHYHDIKKDDQNNGDGLRVTLFLSGCAHHCPECQNPQTWDKRSGIPFREADKEELFNELSKDYISGITFSGGDPLFATSLVEVHNLCVEIKQKFPDKTIWLYTGYTYETIMRDYEEGTLPRVRKDIVTNFVDVLVDGEYKKDLRDLQLKWRGSSNQNVIDVKKSLAENRIVLHCD